MRSVKRIVMVLLTITAGRISVQAQAPVQPAKNTQVFYLTNTNAPGEVNDIVNAIKTMLDRPDKVSLVSGENAIFVQGAPDQLALTQKLIDSLDHPRRTFRLIYTITEVDGGKRVGTQRFAMVVVSGQRTTMKQGNKVPVVTGGANLGHTDSQAQFTYLDVGMNFDVTLDESVSGVRLRSKVEQSSISEDKSIAGVQEPIVRQAVLEGTSVLTPGKPLILGSMDIPDSTRRLDIEVMMELVK